MRQAIESALEQTYGNFEVLVVNDGSDDDGHTEQVAAGFGNKIRYFSKPENEGVSSALNLGLKEMRGEYFSWLSHDDVYLPHKLEMQVACLGRLDDKKTMLFSDYEQIDAAGKFLDSLSFSDRFRPGKPLYAVLLHMINGCTTLIPKTALVESGFFRPLASTQDYDMWFRLARLIAVRHLPGTVLLSRRHSNQGCLRPGSIDEADALLVRLMSKMTEEELMNLESNPERFFSRMFFHLEKKNFRQARQYARKRTSIAALISFGLSHPKTVIGDFLNRLKLLGLARSCKRKIWDGKNGRHH